MGVGEEEGLGAWKSSITAEVQCFHLVHFHLIQVDDIFAQLALPLDSGSRASGQYLSDSPTPPSRPKCFYIPSKVPGKSKRQPLQMSTSAISSLRECSPLSRKHGHLDLSMYFSPMDHTSSVNVVSYGICIQSSSFSLAQQCTSSPYNRTPPAFSLPFPNWKRKFTTPRLSQLGCTSHLWWRVRPLEPEMNVSTLGIN